MTVTQNYGNIILSTPILSADPNVKEDVMTDQQKITILYCRLSNEDSQEGESNSIQNQELLCRGWFLPPNTYDCGSFVVNETAVVGKEQKGLIIAANQHKRS